ncbi:helix-turn-helix domain-containing protein [Enterobacteriaceae bacterium LUAb1]
MNKYSLSFKLEVVQYYLSGQEGQKATARRFGIDHRAVRQWSAAWKLHGVAGLTTRYFTYSPAFKESVIPHRREHRLSVREVCAKLTIPAFSTVCQWERLYDEGGLAALTDSRRRKKMMPERSENHSVSPLQASPDPDEREKPEQRRAAVAYLKKLQALLRERSRSKRGIKRRW